MKIIIQTDETVQETSLTITCKEITPELERLVEAFRLSDKKISVKVNGEVRLIDLKSILYTGNGVYVSQMSLYDLESMLAEHNFIRVNKSTLLNLNRIESLKSDIDRRIKVTLQNGYQLIISRAYAEDFKSKLGI